MFRKQLLFFFFYTIAFTVLGQTYYSKNYSINDAFIDNLPSNTIRSIYLDSRNFLWIGTSEGLCKFDGKKFKTYTEKDGLIGKNIWAIVEDKDGNLWISSYGAGLNRFDGITFTNFSEENGLPGTQIRTLSVNDSNHILIGDDSHGLSIYHNDKDTSFFENFSVKREDDDGRVQIMDFFIKNGNQYFMTFTHGLYKINNTNGYSLEKINPFGGIQYIEDNDTYLYLTGGGIFTGNTKEELDYIDVQNGEKVLSRDIIWDNEKIDNSTYLAAWNVNNTGGGLFRWSNNKLENINSLYDIKSNKLWALEYDTVSKTLWIGTLEKGLYSIDLSLSIKHFSYDPSAFVHNELNILDVRKGRDNIWMLAEEGIIRISDSDTILFKEKRFRNHLIAKNRLDKNEKLKPLDLKTFRVTDNRIYLMTDKGIFIMNWSGEILYYNSIGNTLFELHSNSELLIANQYGAFHVYKRPVEKNSNTFTTYSQKEERHTPHGVINSIKIGSTTYFASMNRGLYAYKDNKPTSLYLNKQFNDLYPTELHYNQGKLYVGTKAGNIYIANVKDTFLIIDSINNEQIIGNRIKFIQTWKDIILVGTNEGISIIDINNKTTRFIDQEQGLLDKTFNCAFLDSNKLFVYSETEYYVINLAKLLDVFNASYDFKLSNIKTDSKKYLNTNVGLWNTFNKQEITLPHNTNTVELHFRGQLTYPNKIRKSYRVNKSDWQNIDENKITLYNMQSGDYIIDTKINNLSNGVISEKKLIKITIKKPFWSTIWFWSIIIICIFLLIIGIIKREKLKANLKNQLVKARLEALRSQMNPHFIFNSINSIQNYIIDKNVDDALMYMGYFSNLIRQTLDNSTYSHIPLFNVIDYLETYIKVENIRFDNKIKLEVESKTIDLEKTSIPPMLIQPLVENAIVHGFKDVKKEFKIRITFIKQDEYIKCSIQDNGVGFDINKKEKSKAFHALEALKERVLLLQGKNKKELEISSSPSGTTIILLIAYNTVA